MHFISFYLNDNKLQKSRSTSPIIVKLYVYLMTHQNVHHKGALSM